MTDEATNRGGKEQPAPKEGLPFWAPSTELSWGLGIGLPVVACLVAWMCLDRGHFITIGMVESLGGELDLPWGTESFGGTEATREGRFLIEGDESRDEFHERQRAIWETDLTNRVFLGNYLSALASGPGQDTNQLAFVRQELALARETDSRNARIDYLEAACVFDAAAEIIEVKADSEEEGDGGVSRRLEARDREALDEAMALFLEGTRKPSMRRYSGEMLSLRFEAMGPPRRLLHLVQRTAVAASVLLPDLMKQRRLARASALYAELLISEGRADEAVPFLAAWYPLTAHLARDSFTLIDVLVVNAMAKEAAERLPPIHESLGRNTDAIRTASQAGAIAKPVSTWRERREEETEADQAGEKALRERGGVLVQLLMPALGIWPDEPAYDPSRRLEYTAATLGLLAGLCLALIAGMFLCLGIAMRWRFGVHGVSPQPLLFLPRLGALCRILLLGVLLPIAVFYVVTRWLPFSGHNYSVAYGGHKLIAEGSLIVTAILVFPVILTARAVRRQCEASGIPTRRWYADYLTWPFWVAGAMLVLVWFCPPSSDERLRVFAGAAAGALGMILLIGALLTVAQGVAGQGKHARFHAVTFGTLMPVLALVIILTGVIARPYLVASEARYLAADTLLNDPIRPGFSRVESDLVERLRGEILVAIVDAAE